MVDYTPVSMLLGGVTMDDAQSTPGASANKIKGNNGRTFLAVENGSASPINVTITTQKTAVDGPHGPHTLASEVVSVAAAETEFIGPFDTARFNDGSGDVLFDISLTTTILCSAFKLP